MAAVRSLWKVMEVCGSLWELMEAWITIWNFMEIFRHSNSGGPLQSCRIFRQLVVQNLCILHRDVNRTGLKLYYLMCQQVAEKFWSCQKVLFWTTSRLSDNFLSDNYWGKVWWCRPITAGRTEWLLPLTPPYNHNPHNYITLVSNQHKIVSTTTVSPTTLY